ncbi:MAG: acyl-CoA dehydrogenase [Pseudomonadota bacterium]|nr:acyl-CoA dehydrogenase [Pseudomonadota bacterium]
MDELLDAALQRLLEKQSSPQVVRDIERGESSTELWQQLEHSGFADVLLPETSGGGGIALGSAFPLLELCGSHLLPLPLAQTMLVRAMLVEAGTSAPPGAIAIAAHGQRDAGVVRCSQVSFGRVADLVLVDVGGPVLLSTGGARSTPGILPLDATLEWPLAALAQATRVAGTYDVESLQACCAAALISGALSNVFRRTLQYANERLQFGRPIGKFQAIQHQLSVLAEHSFAARMAAQIGCQSTTWRPDRLRVAVAKARASEAALEGIAIAHSIHGAIGFTAELDLQLYTRRLHAWRQGAGSESYWHDVLGEALLASPGLPAIDAVRTTTDFSLSEGER